MLSISQNLHDSLVRERVSSLVNRIDAWLLQELAGWARLHDDRRYMLLREILDDAHRSQMEVESDFALYVHLMLSRGESWRDVRGISQVQDAVEDPRLNPGSKLLRIEDALAGAADVHKA